MSGAADGIAHTRTGGVACLLIVGVVLVLTEQLALLTFAGISGISSIGFLPNDFRIAARAATVDLQSDLGMYHQESLAARAATPGLRARASVVVAAIALCIGQSRAGRVQGRRVGLACRATDAQIRAQSRPLPPGAKFVSNKIWFDITLTKPLGVRLMDGPGGPGTGVGVEEVVEGGSAATRLAEATAEGAPPAMWIQEGDELLMVNGQQVGGTTDRAVELIGGAESHELVLKFSRLKRGNVKVVFPGGFSATSPRQAPLAKLAESVGYDWTATGWHKDEATGELYNFYSSDCVAGIVPSVWARHGEDGVKNGLGDYDNWMPLVLRPVSDA